jgi:DNA-directed RNA polymerase specialized sigma24 family protein
MNNPAREDGSRFDNLVARYYPAVYSFAARLTDDPRDASDLASAAFRNTRRQLGQLRNQTAIVTILISAVIRSGLGGA